MHKVIVVEDDRIIRRGICQSIPWEEHGFLVAGEAGDGEVALEIIKKEQPQVVVSDINMPFMNGLEMARHVKEVSPDTRLIFLTGYEDFKYAQEAIKLKAFDYLLKPVDSEELLKKAKEAAADWENVAQKERRITESLPLLQQEFFQKLARDGEQRVDVEKELKELGVQLEGPYYAVILVKDTAADNSFKEKVNAAAAGLFAGISHEVMCVEPGELVILLSLENEGDERKRQLSQELAARCNNEGVATVTFGRTYPDLFELGKSFLESRLAMEMRHIMGTGRVYSFEESVSRSEDSENKLKQLEEKFESHIKAGLPEKVEETLNQIKTAIVAQKNVPLPDLKILALKFSTMLFFEIEKWVKEETHSFNSSEVYEEIMKMQSLTEMMELVSGLVRKWSEAMYQKQEKSHFSHVDQAIQYIRENYHDSSLTLQKVADLIHVSTPYLSNLFKLEKGFNFGEFLVELRMKKAMEILRDGDVKTYEVCEQVGYNNPQYFSICFKKYTGCTPAEYKKKFR
jgi:two-component system response regulator YesN